MGSVPISWTRLLGVAGLAAAVAGCSGTTSSGDAGGGGPGGISGTSGTSGGAGTSAGAAGTGSSNGGAGGSVAASGAGGSAVAGKNGAGGSAAAGNGGAGGSAGNGGAGISAVAGNGGAGKTGGAGSGAAGSRGAGGTGAGGSGVAGTGAAGVTGAGGGAAGSSAGPSPTSLPAHKQACPPIKSGAMTFLGQAVTVWAGTPTATSHGPLVFYWHGTGSNPQEALYGLGQAVINEIIAQGGMVAAQATTNTQGTNTGNGVWYTGDFDVCDEIVACAVEQLHIDMRHIHTVGMSAGGLQTTWMAYARSSYIASAAPYSGGLTRALTLQDTGNVPAAMVVHGAAGSDVVVVDFSVTSARYEADVKAKGGFAMDCNHGGSHMIPAGIGPPTWRFFQDHPYKIAPEPYAAGIPAGFPAYCVIP